MKIQKKYVIASLIGLVTITGAFAYLQYQKLMQYSISPKKVKFKKFSLGLIDLDIFLNFVNKSDIKFTLEKQRYEIFVNGVYLETLKNDSPNVVEPNSTSVLGLNVSFDPKEAFKKIKMTAATFLNTDKVMVKIRSKIKVKYGVISSTITYDYEDTLKNMMA